MQNILFVVAIVSPYQGSVSLIRAVLCMDLSVYLLPFLITPASLSQPAHIFWASTLHVALACGQVGNCPDTAFTEVLLSGSGRRTGSQVASRIGNVVPTLE